MNCPYYGRAMFVSPNAQADLAEPPILLFPQGGNQCALIRHSHAPCAMEFAGSVPDWQVCTLVAEFRPPPMLEKNT